MKSLDLERSRRHDDALDDARPEAPAALGAIHRRAASAGLVPGQALEPAPATSWSFADAINAGLVARDGDGDIAADAGAHVSRAAEGGGHGLPDELRGRFEQSLGTDLGGVRVHSDDAAADAASSLGARAYAVGQDVYMGAGQYQPGTDEGAWLLAHEVAHTVQQRGASAGAQYKLEVSEPGDAMELEADRAASAMIRGEATSVGAGAGVARKIYRDIGDGTPQPAQQTGQGQQGQGQQPQGPVQVNWTIDYDRVYHGDARPTTDRNARTALHVQQMRIQPDSAPSMIPPIQGLVLADTGAVEIGQRPHPRGEGGQVSAAVSYIAQRSVQFRVNVPGAARRQFPAAPIQARIHDAFESSFVGDDVAAAGTALLTDEERAAGITVTGRVAGHPRQYQATPLVYPAVNGGETMNVVVRVPMGTNTVTSEGLNETERTSGDREREQSSAETAVELTQETAQRETQVREMQRSYQSAVERFSRDLSRHSKTTTDRSETQIGAEGNLTLQLASQISASVDVASLIPGGRLASQVLRFLARALPELDAQINQSGTGSLTGRFQHTWGDETTEEDATEFESSLREAITNGYTALWRNELERTVRTQVTTTGRTGGEREREGTNDERNRTERHRTVRSTVPVAADRPELVLRGAPVRSSGGGGGGGD